MPYPTSLIGSKLARVAMSDDLFTFFHLARLAEAERDDGHNETSFKPTGEAFRKLVELRAITNDQGIIHQLILSVARSFIDDRQRCVYAADLVQSFLVRAAYTATGEPVQLLAAEIQARSIARSSRAVILSQPMPNFPGEPSPAYRTYAGVADSHTLSYGSGQHHVSLHNDPDDWATSSRLFIAVK